MATRHDRAISTFDARARKILTNGGTVVGGNGGTYKYDPNTGMATVVRWADGTVPAQDVGTVPAAQPTASPVGTSAQQENRGPETPAERAGVTGPAVGVVSVPTVPVAGPSTPTGPSAEEREAAREAEAKAQRDKEKAEAEDRQRRDAYARLQTVLNDYGLGSLGAAVQTWLVEGLSESEIVQRMRDTPEFKTRFPAIEQRKKKGLPAISPGEYVAYERQARQLMRAAGLPEGYYDGQDDFTRFLENDLSLSELGDRVSLAANAAFKMPKEDRDKLAAWGMGPGDLTAFWLNPDKAQPLLERKYAAAQLAGAGTRSGWGDLNESKATDLALLGVTASEAEQGFGQLVQSRELFGSLDRSEDVIDVDEQLSARFGGNAAAQRRIEDRRRKRQARFEGGGGFAASQQGLSGLGDIDR